MKILLLSMNFAPELTGIGKYSGEMARGLAERGHEVTVVCAPPYYPDWRVHSGWSGTEYRVERPCPGLTVVRCPLWVPRHPTGLKRLLHLFSFALSSLPVMLGLVLWRPAVVFAVAPAFFCAPAAWLTARLSGATAWLHVQDFELDAAFELGLLKGHTTRRVCAAAERLLMRGFDKVSTISRRMMRQLAAKGVPLDQSELLPNWVDLDAVHPTAGSPVMRTALGIRADQTVFLFAGSMNRKQGLPVLFSALDQLAARDDIVLVLCGGGELRSYVDRAAAGRSNVRVLDLQPAERLNELLNMADVHLLPQLAGAADLVMPSKLAGMLASGRPVIAAAVRGSEIASIVAGRGLVVQPEDAGEFALAMQRLAGSAQERQLLGNNARSYAENTLDHQRVLGRLEAGLVQTGVPAPAAPATAALLVQQPDVIR